MGRCTCGVGVDLQIDLSRQWASKELSLNQGSIVNLMANDARRLQYFMCDPRCLFSFHAPAAHSRSL